MLLVRSKSALLAVALSLFCIVGPATASGVTDEQKGLRIEPLDTSFQIYLVGGRCGFPGSWYSKWSAAGLESFTAVKHICSPYEDGAGKEYSANFHVNALQEVELLSSANPSNTIVVTGPVTGPATRGAADLAVVSALRAGITVFHYAGRELDFDAHGLDVNSVRYLRFSPVVMQKAIAELVGKELCRLKGVGHHLKLATFYWSDRPVFDYRIDETLKAYAKYCDAVYSILWSVNGTDQDAANASAPYWAFRPVPEVIITPSDLTAAGALENASSYLLEEDYRLLSSTGWDHSRPDLLNNRKLLTTVDQMVFYPNEGFWHMLQLVIQEIEHKNLKSTADMIRSFDLSDSSMTLNTSGMRIISSDPDGWLLSELMASYDARAAPVGVTEVSSGLHGVTITEFNAFDGLVEAVIWLRVSWYDLRLAWATRAHQGGVEISEDDVWVPPIYFLNQYDHAGLEHVPAYIEPDGKVTIEHNMRSKFLCSTTKPIRSFPFDSYKCSAELALDHPEKNTLNGDLGFKVVDYDHDYIVSVKVIDEHTGKRDIVHFTIEFERRTFKTWARLIVPAILLNLVGFIAFWIPEGGDSIALGSTTLLCTLALRQLVELPDTSDITWSEVFVGICTTYQAIVMFFSFMDYQDGLSKRINDFFGRFRPKKVKFEGNKVAAADKDDGDAAESMAACDSDAENGAPKKREPKRKSRMSGFSIGGRFSQFSAGGLKQGEDGYDDDITNIDWLGRWTVVQTYIFVMLMMLTWVPSAL